MTAVGQRVAVVVPRPLPRVTWRDLRRNPLSLAGACVLVAVVGLAIVAPLLHLDNPELPDVPARLFPALTDFRHPLGTDELGRDILSRIIWGARISLLAGLVSAMGSMLLGVTFGLLAGYFGRAFDLAIMRVTDVLMSFPMLLLALAIVAGLGANLQNAMIAIAVAGTPVYVRLVRSLVLSLREREFVTAAHAIGASRTRIVLRHILPNCVSTVIVMGTLDVGLKINATAALSFLGLGTQPPTPDWGTMLASGRTFVTLAPHVAVVPGLAILVTVLGINLLGDGLRDIIDPQSRRTWKE
jgi:peptide/nickel transport system permease protein